MRRLNRPWLSLLIALVTIVSTSVNCCLMHLTADAAPQDAGTLVRVAANAGHDHAEHAHAQHEHGQHHDHAMNDHAKSDAGAVSLAAADGADCGPAGCDQQSPHVHDCIHSHVQCCSVAAIPLAGNTVAANTDASKIVFAANTDQVLGQRSYPLLRPPRAFA
ncbi:MAG: hypothetical protein ACRCS9_12940 [Hyphomicrobium sp.]